MSPRRKSKKGLSGSDRLPASLRKLAPSPEPRGPRKLRLYESFEQELHDYKSRSQQTENEIEKRNRKLQKREAMFEVIDKNLLRISETFSGNNANYAPLFEDYKDDKFKFLEMKQAKNVQFDEYVTAVREINETQLELQSETPSDGNKGKLEELKNKLRNAEVQRDLVDEKLRLEKNEHTLKALEQTERNFDKYRNTMITHFQPIYQRHNQNVEAESGKFRKMWRDTVKTLNDPEFSGIPVDP